jgi:2-keto-4-pentenoate hydratase/2-oxohepta-3-ene-1,7-dioic acid hydratase in catechol pathway
VKVFAYRADDGPAIGIAGPDGRFTALHEAAPGFPRSLKRTLELPHGIDRIRAVVEGKPATRPLAGLEFLPPIDAPNAFWAMALNFKLHLEETGLTTSPDFPHLFMRHAGSLVGGGQPLRNPPPELSQEHDYEGELGVVIGRGGRHIPVDRALSHVAGFTCVNEGSIREFQRHNRNFGLGKNFEESGSYGPWLVTPDEFGAIGEHTLVTRLNGVERQRTKLDDMLFSVERVIAYLSTGCRLRPGDVIAMGTPGALPPHPGETIDPARQRTRHKTNSGKSSMRTGDVVEVEISGIGTLSNPLAGDEPVGYRPG